MAPPLLQLKDIALTFGGTPLLTGAELSVSTGERVSLVGRNGSGKSTLLKIAAGLIEPDTRLGLRAAGRADPLSAAGAGLLRLCNHAGLCRGRPAAERRPLHRALPAGAARPDRRGRPRAPFGRRSAPRRRSRACWRPSPDILLLDEPTNHLDLPTIEWLERDLDARRTALVIISHDRRFLSKLSRSTVWLDRGTTRRIERGFAHFEEWRDKLLAEEEREQHKLDRKIVARRALDALRRHRRGASATCGASANCRRCASSAAAIAVPPATPAITASDGGAIRRAGDRGQGHRQEPMASRADRQRLLHPHPARRPHRHRRAERQRQDHADQHADRRAGRRTPAPIRLGANLAVATLDQHRDSLDPNVTVARRADRRRRRHGDGQRHAQARHRLHEGLPVLARTGAHAARQAVGRRTRPPDAGAGAGQAVEPAGARRADQRSRHGNARRAGGHARPTIPARCS